VLAKSTHWWKVDFSGAIGWVDEAALSAIIDAPLVILP
jgi:hypothetical protein